MNLRRQLTERHYTNIRTLGFDNILFTAPEITGKQMS